MKYFGKKVRIFISCLGVYFHFSFPCGFPSYWGTPTQMRIDMRGGVGGGHWQGGEKQREGPVVCLQLVADDQEIHVECIAQNMLQKTKTDIRE